MRDPRPAEILIFQGQEEPCIQARIITPKQCRNVIGLTHKMLTAWICLVAIPNFIRVIRTFYNSKSLRNYYH